MENLADKIAQTAEKPTVTPIARKPGRPQIRSGRLSIRLSGWALEFLRKRKNRTGETYTDTVERALRALD